MAQENRCYWQTMILLPCGAPSLPGNVWCWEEKEKQPNLMLFLTLSYGEICVIELYLVWKKAKLLVLRIVLSHFLLFLSTNWECYTVGSTQLSRLLRKASCPLNKEYLAAGALPLYRKCECYIYIVKYTST